MKRKVLLLTIILLCFSSLGAVSTDWFYNTLDNEQQELYNRIVDAVLYCKDKIDDVSFDERECLRIYLGYLDDHPGIFWVGNKIEYRTFREKGETKHSIVFCYTHQDNLKADQARFINLVNMFSSYLKNYPDDYVKLFHIYDYLASTIEYSIDYPDQTMWSVFFDGIGVCAGFARSFQYLALLEGIPAVVVHGNGRNRDGTISETGHLWVVAEIDGKWYHFDPTWARDDGNSDVDYIYFCRSQERIELTHVIDDDYLIPERGDDSLSYVRVMERYLTAYSEKAIISIIDKAVERGETTFTIEFADREGFETAVRNLFEEGKIFLILQKSGINDINTVSYMIDDTAYSIKLFLDI